MKAQAQSKQVKPVADGSTPRQALAGIQVFSKPGEIQGAVVRQPFRLGSRKGRFFQSVHVGLLMLLLVFIGRDELRAQHAPGANSGHAFAADMLHPWWRTVLPLARLATGQDVPGEVQEVQPRHFLPHSTANKYRVFTQPPAA